MSAWFAFDFDGVICDSANETGLSAWRAATQMWPDEFPGGLEQPPDDAFRASLARCRPVIEKGLHNVALVAMLHRGVSEEEILRSFDRLFAEWVARERLTEKELRDAFGRARDTWLARDLDHWLSAQGFYPGVVAAVNALDAPKCIITTKERRFTLALLEHAGLRMAQSEIFTLESMEGGSKRTILQTKLDADPACEIHFFEDRMPTQIKLVDMDRLNRYIVDWGYNTQAERDEARAHPRIELIDANRFAELLRPAEET